jgi:hypothetical protein
MNIEIHVHAKKVKRQKRPKLTLRWAIGPVSEQHTIPGPRGVAPMLQLTNTQQCGLAVSAVDRKGNAARVDAIVFSSSDVSVATVAADDLDASKALVKAVAPGTAQINVTADADLGDGVAPLSGTLDIVVVAGQAVGFVINTGTPEEQQ